MLTVHRRFDFCAGHRLYRPEWSETENERVFGPCANPAGHGHNYTLEVGVSGPLNPETGMITNLRPLKERIWDEVTADVDHKNLNEDVSWMQGKIPTTEVFAETLWERIEAVVQGISNDLRLERLELRETPNNRVIKTRS